MYGATASQSLRRRNGCYRAHSNFANIPSSMLFASKSPCDATRASRTESSRGDDLRVDARLPEHALYGGVVQPELASDGAERPLLGVVEAEDLGLGFLGDHARLPSVRRSSRDAR